MFVVCRQLFTVLALLTFVVVGQAATQPIYLFRASYPQEYETTKWVLVTATDKPGSLIPNYTVYYGQTGKMAAYEVENIDHIDSFGRIFHLRKGGTLKVPHQWRWEMELPKISLAKQGLHTNFNRDLQTLDIDQLSKLVGPSFRGVEELRHTRTDFFRFLEEMPDRFTSKSGGLNVTPRYLLTVPPPRTSNSFSYTELTNVVVLEEPRQGFLPKTIVYIGTPGKMTRHEVENIDRHANDDQTFHLKDGRSLDIPQDLDRKLARIINFDGSGDIRLHSALDAELDVLDKSMLSKLLGTQVNKISPVRSDFIDFLYQRRAVSCRKLFN
jgi:hypothetical protein